MAWARLDDGIYSHPKVLGTSLEALGLYLLALAYAARHLTDGALTAPAVAMLSRGQDGLAAELVAHGLWEAPNATGGYAIHDYLDWNISAKDVNSLRKAAKDRMRAYRLRSPEQTANERRTNAFVPVGREAGAKAPSRALRQKLTDQKQETASATNAETAHANKSKSEAAAQLIAEINRVGGRNFSVTAKANLTFARARLADYPLPELLAMIRWRWRMWDEGMRGQFFRPETLLNATKCESYLGSMPATERAGVPRAAVRNLELERIAVRDRELGRG